LNRMYSSLFRRAHSSTSPSRLIGGPTVRGAALTVLALAAAASGCARDRAFSVNGQVVTKDEYIKTLERQTVVAPGGGGNSTGIKSALDQLVGNKVILGEATKDGVLPTDDQVTHYYNTQKKLFLATNPGKDYEKAMADEGTTPKDVQDQMKVQLAEAAVYAKRLGITDQQIQTAYADSHGGFGLPARVQLRMVIPTTPAELSQAQTQLASKTADFNPAAAKINPPQLKATQGIWPQTIPLTGGMAADIASKVQQTADGAFFGPIDFRTSADPKVPPVKAWIKVEKKMPAMTIPLEDARDLVRAQLVQQKLRDPASQTVRTDLIKDKLNASFEADPKYVSVWNTLKTGAAAAIASQPPAAPGGVTQPAPGAAIDSATTPLTK